MESSRPTMPLADWCQKARSRHWTWWLADDCDSEMLWQDDGPAKILALGCEYTLTVDTPDNQSYQIGGAEPEALFHRAWEAIGEPH